MSSKESQLGSHPLVIFNQCVALMKMSRFLMLSSNMSTLFLTPWEGKMMLEEGGYFWKQESKS